MKKRVTYLDLAKGAGIILVVLGHMENIDVSIRTWISSFHMPLFFIISGMLIALKSEDRFVYENSSDKDLNGLSDIIRKKAKGILIPYFWFSLIYIPIDIMNLYIDNVDEHTFVQNILDSATLSGISVMWFLPALFLAEITALFLLKKSFRIISEKSGEGKVLSAKILALAISFAVSALAFTVWGMIRPTYESVSGNYAFCTLLGIIRVVLRGIAMSFHVLLGYVIFEIIKKVESWYINRSKDEKKASLEVRGYSLAAGIIISIINIGLCMKNGAVDNHFMIAGNLFLYYSCALYGSLGLILICKGFDSIKPVDFLGKNSLIIMATHLQCYILYAGILIAIAIDAYVTRAKSYVYMFNSVLFTMLIEAVIIIVINKCFPFILGKGSIKDIFIFGKRKSEN